MRFSEVMTIKLRKNEGRSLCPTNFNLFNYTDFKVLFTV